MVRVLKQLDYYNLIVLVYKHSGYDIDKSKVLYKYVTYHLIKKGFNEIYLEKLAFDLNLLNPEKELKFIHSETEYKKTIKTLEEMFTHYEVVNFKSLIWDILHKGYHD